MYAYAYTHTDTYICIYIHVVSVSRLEPSLPILKVRSILIADVVYTYIVWFIMSSGKIWKHRRIDQHSFIQHP